MGKVEFISSSSSNSSSKLFKFSVFKIHSPSLRAFARSIFFFLSLLDIEPKALLC